jgi:hypothetical protein
VDVDWSAEDYYRHLNVKPFSGREVHKLLIKRTKQKPGVYLESLEPAMDTAGLEVINAFHQVLGDDYVPVITSGNDWPYHARKSKHYENKAIDFRIKYIPLEQRREIVNLVTGRLSPRFRIIWERGDAEHLHLELSEYLGIRSSEFRIEIIAAKPPN